MSPPGAPPTVRVGGWTVSLLELDALYAPLRWVLPHAAEEETAWLPCHILVCGRTGEVMLVDAGLGALDGFFDDIAVRTTPLDEGLGRVGCSSGDVSTVVLTHLDPDHAGGVVTGDFPERLRPALPGARVVTLRQDGEMADHAETVVSALAAAGSPVEFVDDGTEIVPGLRIRSAPGHRAGHAAVELADAGERLVFLADVVHAREHVANPEWDFLHDSEPEVALETRRRLVAELEGSGALVACSHVDSFGRIEPGPAWVDIG
ncbi:MAG TPA: MBL fold metallo-hydrolase [Gaiellaceae bacterium]|nr:MBL fold metallo-hydrolase [Gaiellaceae bacterium]